MGNRSSSLELCGLRTGKTAMQMARRSRSGSNQLLFGTVILGTMAGMIIAGIVEEDVAEEASVVGVETIRGDATTEIREDGHDCVIVNKLELKQTIAQSQATSPTSNHNLTTRSISIVQSDPICAIKAFCLQYS